MKKLFYAITGAVFLGLTAPVIGATGEAWAEEVIGPDAVSYTHLDVYKRQD